MTKIFILAAGICERWGGQIKQLAEINGEPLIVRTLNMLKGHDVTVITVHDVIKDLLQDRSEVWTHPWESDTLLDTVFSTLRYWCEGRNIYLLGDVVYTQETLKAILESDRNPQFFASKDETFAMCFDNSIKEQIVSEIEHILSLGLAGTTWQLYRRLAGIPIDRDWTDSWYHTRVNDKTDDIDYPEDYQKKRLSGYYEDMSYDTPIALPNNSSKRLSILMCNLEGRDTTFQQIHSILSSQLTDEVEILVETDRGEMSIGAKRNLLMSKAVGDYICYVDDDDMVPEYYIQKILIALDTNPDCVGMNGIYKHSAGEAKFQHSRIHTEWKTNPDGVHLRCPNHLNPIKREIALQVKFPEKDHGEDYEWSMAIKDKLVTEVMIEMVMYYYLKA